MFRFLQKPCSVWFSLFEGHKHRFVFLGIYSAVLVFISIFLGLCFAVIDFWNIFNHHYFNYLFCFAFSFCFFQYSNYIHAQDFKVSLRCWLFCFPPNTFSFQFHFGSLCWHFFKLTDSLLWPCVVNWIPQSHSSFLYSLCDFSRFLLIKFLRISFSLFALPMCSGMLSTFSMKALSVSGRVISNPLYNNSSICATSESGADAYFVS